MTLVVTAGRWLGPQQGRRKAHVASRGAGLPHSTAASGWAGLLHGARPEVRDPANSRQDTALEAVAWAPASRRSATVQQAQARH